MLPAPAPRSRRDGASLWVLLVGGVVLGGCLLFGAVLLAPFLGRSPAAREQAAAGGNRGLPPPGATPNPNPSAPPNGTAGGANQRIQDIYGRYDDLVRQNLCARAVWMTLTDAGAFPGNPGLNSAWQYYDHLSGLANTAGSGWTAHYANDLSQVPAGAVTVFDAVNRNGNTSTGYTHGHIMIGSQYNGSAQVRPNWMGGAGGGGGVYFTYQSPGG